MESKKGRPGPRWLVILEGIRSPNRATLEAVEASRTALEGRLDLFEQKTDSRFTVVEAAIRDLTVSVQQNTSDIRDLAGKVEALSHLEERVSALEHASGAGEAGRSSL